MEIIKSPQQMQEIAFSLKGQGKSIALVPTMGYLHEGHLSLLRLGRAAADVLVVSIFVNPAQFGPAEDFKDYPRNMERDLKLCEDEGTDIVFAPSSEDMYPEGYSTYVKEERFSRGLCGSKRPGHFRGVATIVIKLFNIMAPAVAFFGQKDYQQSRVIGKMVEDLNLPVKIEVGPTVREEDGLALSSRNEYLDPAERKEALSLYRSLRRAEAMIRAGERNAEKIKRAMKEIIERESSSRIDYIGIVNAETMEPLPRVEDNTLIALAVFIGRTRLIDNAVVRLDNY